MSFMFVIVPFDTMRPDAQKMAAFYSSGGIQELTQSEGVFPISETAWIFDIRKSLPAFSQVVYAAHRSQVQLYVFQLDDEAARSHVLSYPRSEKLEAFLAS